MAEHDKSQAIRIAGVHGVPNGEHEEIVCYSVVTGRGRAMVRYMRDEKSREFARRLVECYRVVQEIKTLVQRFDETEWLDREDKRRGRAELVRAVRETLESVPPA